MLGYDADVLELRAGVGEREVMRIARLPHEKRGGYLKTIVSRRVARVPFRTWVDQLLDAVDDGRAQMLIHRQLAGIFAPGRVLGSGAFRHRSSVPLIGVRYGGSAHSGWGEALGRGVTG